MSDFKLFSMVDNEPVFFCTLFNIYRDNYTIMLDDFCAMTWVLVKDVKPETNDKFDIDGNVWRLLI